jgi:transposase
MGCRLRIFLNKDENLTLQQLRSSSCVPQRTKDRAFVLLLNAQGLTNLKIAKGLNWAESTVRQTIHRWLKFGLVGLWDAPGRGVKPRWQESDLVYLEKCLQEEPRTYNSRQLAQKLESERQINLSPDRIRRVLKKKGGVGNVPELAIKTNRHLENPRAFNAIFCLHGQASQATRTLYPILGQHFSQTRSTSRI